MGSNELKEISLVTWEDFHRPKYERGLEIRMNEGINKASITKLEWRILTDNDNYRKYIGTQLKWCIKDSTKVNFWIDFWVYIMLLASFVHENHLNYFNWDVKVYDFIN